MEQNWIVTLPAILVLLVSIITRNVILSLLAGIISASFIASNFFTLPALSLIINRIIEQSNIKSLFLENQPLGHLYTFGFLIFLGILITLITITGGAVAYSKIIEPKLKSKQNVEFMSLFFSCFLFLDDYLNCLITSCVMKPLTDKFKIPRAKLAYLLDAMSGSLCVLVPISSWIALILTEFRTSGITEVSTKGTLLIADPFRVYLNSILFMFYPILSIITVFLIVKHKISYGLMHEHEVVAEKDNNLFNGKKSLELNLAQGVKDCKTNGSISDFVLPISSFLIFTIVFMFYLSGWSIEKFLSVNPIIALFYSSLLTVILSIIYFLLQKKILLKNLGNVIISGFNSMRNSLVVLLFAWTLGSILEQDLHTGQYIASILIGAVPNFLLPLIIFFTTIIIVAATSSAWGTIAIMLPLAIPAAIEFTSSITPITANSAYLVYSVIASVISGAIAGGHISPVSDSTIISSTSAGAYTIDHLVTQLAYVIPVILASSVSFIVTGLLFFSFRLYNHFMVSLISLIIGIVLNILIILIFSKIKIKKDQN